MFKFITVEKIEYDPSKAPKLTEANRKNQKHTHKDYIDAFNEYGGYRQAARALGVNFSTVRKHVLHQKTDKAIKEAMDAVGTEIKPSHIYYKTHKNGPPTYTVLLKPPDEEQEGIMDAIRDTFNGLPPAPQISKPKRLKKDSMTAYPIFDAHIGLRALKESCGEDWGPKIAAEFIADAFSTIVHGAQPSKSAVIANGGDFTHSDDDKNETPAHHHKVDTEGFHHENIDLGIRLADTCIQMALQRHETVTYQQGRGNHDPDTATAIAYALRERYRNTKRVAIIPPHESEFFITEFGKTMLVTHHGDKATWNRLAVFIPEMWPEEWGRTRHRYCLSGHLHRERSMDIGGLRFETMRAATKKDRYAYGSAFSGRSQLRAISYHKEGGEYARSVFNY